LAQVAADDIILTQVLSVSMSCIVAKQPYFNCMFNVIETLWRLELFNMRITIVLSRLLSVT